MVTLVRAHYQGVLVGNMGYGGDEAATAIADGTLDAVAFGVPSLANPDLPARLKQGAELNAADPSTFYSPGAKGYTDYPVLEMAAAERRRVHCRHAFGRNPGLPIGLFLASFMVGSRTLPASFPDAAPTAGAASGVTT